MKHPTEDHSLFDIDLIDELVEECLQLEMCKYENPKCSNKAEIQVVETKKLFPEQVATMITAKYESTKGDRDRERTKVNLAKKTSVKANIIVRAQAETILTYKD
ncbi:hypothetical protein CR513_20491, partial [Mucuna pruriens]